MFFLIFKIHNKIREEFCLTCLMNAAVITSLTFNKSEANKIVNIAVFLYADIRCI